MTSEIIEKTEKIKLMKKQNISNWNYGDVFEHKRLSMQVIAIVMWKHYGKAKNIVQKYCRSYYLNCGKKNCYKIKFISINEYNYRRVVSPLKSFWLNSFCSFN